MSVSHVHRFEVFKDTQGDLRWHLKNGNNGKIVAEGGGYANGVDLVKTVRKHITRGHALMDEALSRALARAGLDDRGRVRTR